MDRSVIRKEIRHDLRPTTAEHEANYRVEDTVQVGCSERAVGVGFLKSWR